MWKNETHTGTINFNAQFSTCCMRGIIQLPVISDPPELLKNLLSGDTNNSKHFQHNIRAFNSSLAFASFGVKEDICISQNRTSFPDVGHNLVKFIYLIQTMNWQID